MDLCTIVDKSKIIDVDLWGTEEYPIDPEDILFKNIKGEIILPISEFFGTPTEESKQLDYFIVSIKRSYNSDGARDNLCLYLNYFEKFYDEDKELLSILYHLKFTIDYNKSYSKDNFIDDINRYIIRNVSLGRKITRFVTDNYKIKLSNNGGRTPNLQFNSKHAKILYEIKIIMNMYIPLATHYMYIHMIDKSKDVKDFMLELYDKCVIKYEEERGVYIHNKLYETALSVVNKSKNSDKKLWDKNLIRGNNHTTHIKDTVNDTILQIIPKYSFDRNIINLNYYSNRSSLRYKITDVAYEFNFDRLSSYERDQDQNSEYDRYEARLNKKDSALALQNKVAAEQSMKRIESLYGYDITNDEVNHFRKALTANGTQIINKLTNQLLGYLYYKDLGDPETWKSIPNTTSYIRLMICARRILTDSGMIILPHILSSKVIRASSRKVISKNNSMEIKNAELYKLFVDKYNNPKIQQKWFELLGTIKATTFQIIDYDLKNKCAGPLDGKPLPIIDDIIDEEFLHFTIMI